MTRSSGKFPQTHDTSCFPMLLLAICSPATDFCVLAWCHVGTRQMKPEIWNPSLACCLATQFLDTYLKEMLCKQVEESVSHSGCQVGISSLGACESPTSSFWLNISLPPRTREPSWKEGHFNSNKHAVWPMPPSVPKVSLYRNVWQFSWIDLRRVKVNVWGAIADWVIENKKLPLRENRHIEGRSMCSFHCWLQGHRWQVQWRWIHPGGKRVPLHNTEV